MDGEPGERAGSAEADAARAATDARAFAALRHLASALAALVAVEARLFKARVGLIVLAGVALVAFAISLWACAVALIGWALRLATGSTGAALGLMVVLHLILVTLSWWSIKRGLREASFPKTRGEWAALRDGLRRGAAR